MMVVRHEGSVLSDLHLLTNRTTVDKYMGYICASAVSSRVFIFNGDIFDFQWSREGCIPSSVEWALDWVRGLVEAFPGCRFVFMAGNHDSLEGYCEGMAALAEVYDTLFWEVYYVCLGSRVFLHGDVCHGGVAGEGLDAYRAHWNRPVQKHPVFHGLYWLTAKSGLQHLVLPFQFKRRCAGRIARYLGRVLPEGVGDGLRHVYFGHVHRSFEDFVYGGYCFHNTGAALHGIRLRVLHFPVEEGDRLVFSNGVEVGLG